MQEIKDIDTKLDYLTEAYYYKKLLKYKENYKELYNNSYMLRHGDVVRDFKMHYLLDFDGCVVDLKIHIRKKLEIPPSDYLRTAPLKERLYKYNVDYFIPKRYLNASYISVKEAKRYNEYYTYYELTNTSEDCKVIRQLTPEEKKQLSDFFSNLIQARADYVSHYLLKKYNNIE